MPDFYDYLPAYGLQGALLTRAAYLPRPYVSEWPLPAQFYYGYYARTARCYVSWAEHASRAAVDNLRIQRQPQRQPPNAATAHMKCLKHTMKTNERWALLSKQTYLEIVDATLKEMTSVDSGAKHRQTDDDDEDAEDEDDDVSRGHSGPLQLARSVTPIFRRSPGAGRAGTRSRGTPVSASPRSKTHSQSFGVHSKEAQVLDTYRECHRPTDEPLDLSTHSRPDSLANISTGKHRSVDVGHRGYNPASRGLSVQAVHKWHTGRVHTAPADPAAMPCAQVMRAQLQASQSACSKSSGSSSGLAPLGNTCQSEPHTYTQTLDVCTRVPVNTMSSGLAMTSHAGLRQDLWVPFNKDTVLGLVNDVVDSMVSSEGSDRQGEKDTGGEKASSPLSTMTGRQTGHKTRPRPPPIKSVIDTQGPDPNLSPSKSTSQKENIQTPPSTPGRRNSGPTSPSKGRENADRWVAINKKAMRDIVDNAIRCELQADDVEVPDKMDTEVDHNANQRQSQNPRPSRNKRSRSRSPEANVKRTRPDETEGPEQERVGQSPDIQPSEALNKLSLRDRVSEKESRSGGTPPAPRRPRSQLSSPDTTLTKNAATLKLLSARSCKVQSPESSNQNAPSDSKMESISSGSPHSSQRSSPVSAWVAVSQTIVTSMIECLLESETPLSVPTDSSKRSKSPHKEPDPDVEPEGPRDLRTRDVRTPSNDVKSPRSPAPSTIGSPDNEDSTSEPVAPSKSSFKLKSAMLERFNEERKSSASPSLSSVSPSVPSSSPSLASSSPSSSSCPPSPTTSKIKAVVVGTEDRSSGDRSSGDRSSGDRSFKEPQGPQGPQGASPVAHKKRLHKSRQLPS